MTPLQLALYRHLLESGLVQACLRHNSNSSPHLVCIGALKKFCNCPSLIYSASTQDAVAIEIQEGCEGEMWKRFVCVFVCVRACVCVCVCMCVYMN